ncbi:MAG: L-2-amino-thiazoline-4-carboxylic acid hydrolase [Roseburia sp.]
MELIESKYAVSYRKEMEKMLKTEKVEGVWKNAEKIFQDILAENPEQTEGIRKHTYVSIFPTIAVYMSLMSAGCAEAMEIIQRGSAEVAKTAGEQYAKIVRIPGFKGIFMKIFSKGVKEGFGQEAGFANEFITDTSKKLAFNITKCPYQDYCQKYECPELVSIFCKNDEYAYGNLQGITFKRTQTLGTGGKCCDFRLER